MPRSFTSYFITGSIAVLLSWALSGCRFGNRVEQPAPTSTINYFRSEAKELQFCAQMKSEKDPRCVDDANLKLLPNLIKHIINNPVGLFHNLKTNEFLLFDPLQEGAKPAMPTSVEDGSGIIDFKGQSSAQVVWRDDACKVTTKLYQTGHADTKNPETVKGISTLGRLQIVVQYFYFYDGDCGATFHDIAKCYKSVTDCGGSTSDENSMIQQQVNDLIGSYIDVGIFTLDNLNDISALAFGVSYE